MELQGFVFWFYFVYTYVICTCCTRPADRITNYESVKNDCAVRIHCNPPFSHFPVLPQPIQPIILVKNTVLLLGNTTTRGGRVNLSWLLRRTTLAVEGVVTRTNPATPAVRRVKPFDVKRRPYNRETSIPARTALYNRAIDLSSE